MRRETTFSIPKNQTDTPMKKVEVGFNASMFLILIYYILQLMGGAGL